MSLTGTNVKTYYPGPGGTVFPTTFKVFASSEVVVQKLDQTTDEVVATLALDTDYTIAGVGNPAATITLNDDLGDYALLLRRVTVPTQAKRLPDTGAFYPSTVENALDLATATLQEHDEQLARSIKLKILAPLGGVEINPTPGYALGFDADGNVAPVANTGADQTIAMQNYVSPRDIKADGAVVNGVTNDASAVADTLAAAALGNAIRVPGESNIGTARIANQRGVSIEGPGLLEYTPSSVLGTRVQNAKGRGRLAWGSEYLYQFLVKFIARTATTIRYSGDSTTAQSNQYCDYLTAMLANWPSITPTKAGFSGKNTGDWLSTYLAGDIAANADVLIWHWGMNDCSSQGRTLAQFEADLRAGLTTYRTTRPIASNGIILMTPNASSDGTGGRDEKFQEKISRIIKNVAEDFQCAYFDTYGIFQDGYVGIGSWIDDFSGDHLRGVHPQPTFAQSIAGEVLDLLIPKGIRRIAGDTGVSNANGNAFALPASLPSTYPAGVSIRRALASDGWPIDGFVLTFYENITSTYALQINWAYNATGAPQIRHFASGAWQAFGLLLAAYNNILTVVGASPSFRKTASSGNVFDSFSRLNGNAAYIETQTNGSTRWRIYTGLNDGESTGDLGTSFAISAHTDTGTFIDYPFYLNRKAGGAIELGGSTSRPVIHKAHTCYTGKAFTANGAATTFTYPANTRYQYITTSAASLATTLPATSAALDGMVITFVAGSAVATATWVAGAGGATIVGAPAALVANTPVRFIYHHATTSWYPY